MYSDRTEYCSVLTAPYGGGVFDINPDPSGKVASAARSSGEIRSFGKDELFAFLEKVKGVGRPTIADHFTFLPFYYRDQKLDYRIIVYESGIIAITADRGDSVCNTEDWSTVVRYIEDKFKEIACKLGKEEPRFVPHYTIGIRRRRDYERALKVFGEEGNYDFKEHLREHGANEGLLKTARKMEAIHKRTHAAIKKRRKVFDPNIDEGVAVARAMSHLEKSEIHWNDTAYLYCHREFNSWNTNLIDNTARTYAGIAKEDGDGSAFKKAIETMNMGNGRKALFSQGSDKLWERKKC